MPEVFSYNKISGLFYFFEYKRNNSFPFVIPGVDVKIMDFICFLNIKERASLRCLFERSSLYFR